VIVSFRNRQTEIVWRGEQSRRLPPSIHASALRKLRVLNQATNLAELAVPRGNRLGPLSGDRLGQFGLRVNDQWRICFRWTERGPEDVEIVDYHS
jgi:proteic killer suppression protein